MSGANITSFSNQLLKSYCLGIFPMGKHGSAKEIEWVQPRIRGIIPIGEMYASKTTRRHAKSGRFRVTFDRNFEDVITACSEREATWINNKIKTEYITLHEIGFAHSVEVWDHRKLVGGLYGVTIGAAFFGESMFSKVNNCSKLAMLAAMARLKVAGFTLFDTQFPSPHLKTLGGIAVAHNIFIKQLDSSINKIANFNAITTENSWDKILSAATK